MNVTRPKTIAAICAAAVLMFSAYTASAAEYTGMEVDDTPSGEAMAFDLLIVRPAALVGTIVGTGVFILQMPIAILQGEPPVEPFRKLVVGPARYTFTRKLGSLE